MPSHDNDRPTAGTPAYYDRVARTTLYVSPLGFVIAFVLAAAQGAATWICLLLGAIMFVGTLAAAALIKLRGASASGDAAWLALILRLLVGR